MKRYTFIGTDIEEIKDGFKVTATGWTRGESKEPKTGGVMALKGVKFASMPKLSAPAITFGIVSNAAYVNGKRVGDLHPNRTNTALAVGAEGAETVKLTERKGRYIVSIGEDVLNAK